MSFQLISILVSSIGFNLILYGIYIFMLKRHQNQTQQPIAQ